MAIRLAKFVEGVAFGLLFLGHSCMSAIMLVMLIYWTHDPKNAPVWLVVPYCIGFFAFLFAVAHMHGVWAWDAFKASVIRAEEGGAE